ncbi:MAG TPA: (p)ppGpp synthetase, partial [Ruminococcaceae bacterium]|nr:(p)ppGpp synthetase [Oscillospiraceae bacterium]
KNVPADISKSPEPDRWVKAHWEGEIKEKFNATLEIVAEDRSGLLADVTQQLFNMRLFIHSLNSRENKDGSAVISATISVNGIDHLKSVIERLSNIDGITYVRRA